MPRPSQHIPLSARAGSVQVGTAPVLLPNMAGFSVIDDPLLELASGGGESGFPTNGLRFLWNALNLSGANGDQIATLVDESGLGNDAPATATRTGGLVVDSLGAGLHGLGTHTRNPADHGNKTRYEPPASILADVWLDAEASPSSWFFLFKTLDVSSNNTWFLALDSGSSGSYEISHNNGGDIRPRWAGAQGYITAGIADDGLYLVEVRTGGGSALGADLVDTEVFVNGVSVGTQAGGDTKDSLDEFYFFQQGGGSSPLAAIVYHISIFAFTNADGRQPLAERTRAYEEINSAWGTSIVPAAPVN